MSKPHDQTFSEEETARRRDEVVRQMANTPPQPRVTAPNRPSKTRKKAAKGHASRGKKSAPKP
jgi:hypothetical protein